MKRAVGLLLLLIFAVISASAGPGKIKSHPPRSPKAYTYKKIKPRKYKAPKGAHHYPKQKRRKR